MLCSKSYILISRFSPIIHPLIPLSLSSCLLHEAQAKEPKASGRRKRVEDVLDINAPGVAHRESVTVNRISCNMSHINTYDPYIALEEVPWFTFCWAQFLSACLSSSICRYYCPKLTIMRNSKTDLKTVEMQSHLSLPSLRLLGNYLNCEGFLMLLQDFGACCWWLNCRKRLCTLCVSYNACM